MKNLVSFLKKNILYLAWVQTLVALFSSLYFSEIANFAPCLLCWYQRILMYPLTIILAVGIWRKDKNLPLYVLPFSLLGMLVAFYHLLLERGVIPEAAATCRLGVSCTTKYINWFGFITIPLLSFTAFFIITACLFIYIRSQNGVRG